jgi:hypothetical protein
MSKLLSLEAPRRESQAGDRECGSGEKRSGGESVGDHARRLITGDEADDREDEVLRLRKDPVEAGDQVREPLVRNERLEA